MFFVTFVLLLIYFKSLKNENHENLLCHLSFGISFIL